MLEHAVRARDQDEIRRLLGRRREEPSLPVAQIDVSGPTASVTGWRTEIYDQPCSRTGKVGFMRDVEKLWGAGFALGASLENTVAIGEDGVINPEGLRYADEFVRHKILDAVGDLSLSGFPLLATYRSYCGGHRLNFSVVEALFSSRANYAIVEAGTRRETGYAEIGNGIAIPAYAPEVH